jgi:hypothetical protein
VFEIDRNSCSVCALFCRIFCEILTTWMKINRHFIDEYQASTTTLITHLSDIFWLVSLRAVERAHIWSKFFIIECDRDYRLENLVLATPATKFRRKNASQKIEKIDFSQQHCQFSSVFRSVFEIIIDSTLFFYISTFFQIIETSSSRYNAFVFVYLFTTTFEVRRNKLRGYLR